MKFKKTTLPNGLRVITVPVVGNPSVMVMVMVETGSNYETKSENGLSHFLEHVCFKGTTNRPTVNGIAAELDGLGAKTNAFTSNEYTGYYAKASRKHLPKLVEIIADLYLNPTLPQEEIEKERGVILEEINMYEDLPQRKVGDVLARLMYGDTSIGRSTLGVPETIKRLNRKDFVNYRKRHYVASSTVVIIAGDVNDKLVLKEVKKNFDGISTNKKISRPAVKEKQTSPALSILKKKTDQNHLIMAFRSYGAKDKRLPALSLLAGILGGGMSSRLFYKLRDEMGACYYVRAWHDQSKDHGVFGISAGINLLRTNEVTKVLVEQCKKLTKNLVSPEELNKAKEYYIGHLHMDTETTDSIAEFYAEQEINVGQLKSTKELEKLIRAVTAEDILAVARDIFKGRNLNLAMVGNVTNGKSLKKTLSFK
ncbi:MAG: pitrilysin family protein [Minisyncoccia bacterium]